MSEDVKIYKAGLKIDKLKTLADKIAELLINEEDVEINHNEYGTLVMFDNVEFSYDEDGKSEGLTVSL